MSTEQPAYETIKRDGDFEVRRYNGYILAQVEVKSDFDDALYRGFRALFDYITGQNRVRSKIPMTIPVTEEIVEGNENIPMTAPVTAEATGEGIYSIAFVMPGKYTLETLPQPDNKDIHFREVEDHNAAVIRFSGHSHEPRVERRSSSWRNGCGGMAWCRSRVSGWPGMTPHGYHGFMRRNEACEIMVDI